MGCQSDVELGQNLTFSICTHDPDTGVLTDADSAPTYRVYEDETATPILTGSMAKLDDANTTGFYSEQIACTTANGFEVDKSYTVYIEATVDSDKGGIAFSFKVTDLHQVLTGKWEIVDNQLKMYAADGTTVLYTYNLTRDAEATEFNPDLRTPV